jgi:hypothetical protein
VKQTATDLEIESLQQAIEKTAVCGELTLELQRTPKRKPRTARLTVRISSLELLPPLHHAQRSDLKPVQVQVVWAIEEMPPVGEKAISWLLLTTLEVTNFEQASRWKALVQLSLANRTLPLHPEKWLSLGAIATRNR